MIGTKPSNNVTIKDVKPEEFIKAYAEHLKKT